MTTKLVPIDNSVNLLALRNINFADLDEVTAWFYALDIPMSEYSNLCKYILSCGVLSFSNVEHRVTVECSTNY